MNISDLIIGEGYSNDELMDAFKCGKSGGMRRSKTTNTLVIVFDHNKMYDDAWKGDILHYTGMGRIGDQDINYMQNKTLNELNENLKIDESMIKAQEDETNSLKSSIDKEISKYKTKLEKLCGVGTL